MLFCVSRSFVNQFFFLVHFHRIGVSASIEDDQNFSENELEFYDEDSLIETYGLLGKIQCKLCVEVMRPVAKAVRKDSAKVNLLNYFIKISISIIKFSITF